MTDETNLPDVDSLLQPVSDEFPSGEALDYDIDFLQLEIAARGRSEQQMGDAISSGSEPDWALVSSLALELSGRSKDIRVAVLLGRALLHSSGFVGLDPALRLLAGYVDGFWATLHPAPEPDEDDTIRLNALAALSDPAGLLGEMRRAPLVASRALGTFSLRDVQAAAREPSPGSDRPGITQVDIEAAFLSAAPGSLAATAGALASCRASLDAIAAAVAGRDLPAGGVLLEEVVRTLHQARVVIDDNSPRMASGAEEDTGPQAPADEAQARTGRGEIRGRSDVVAHLDLICRWYATSEPGSPVPILLNRARRLVSQDFLSLLAELAPAGLDQFRILAGSGEDAA